MITFKNYELHEEPAAPGTWELRKTYTGKTKDGEPREAYKTLGYAMTLERCIIMIASDVAQEKSMHNAYTLGAYLKEYRDAVKELTDILREVQR